ncbi:rab geranylgeranyl transferase escort [Grosmannia clavigera kw1407]|uniref:Rab proteins geranylgeranyltransferase n=1 Tax=Grosmannia clavigera (strain kw1407 / UAMH 11150) TaxID=655863 RepID=F0XT98_GROCL|nr:rab geranylgeranyl transferase escort [Grosmannia clavigera kw1407]EFW99138.1 rab geranylgeranyl transferase escort [Grosmannia clavigera kw1407]
MESISDTIWDVVICGTGLQQSLLALALSRSDKKILHIDPNEYYGGAEASLSLQEADAWASRYGGLEPSTSAVPVFSNVSVSRLESHEDGAVLASSNPKLAASRSYALALAPQLLHSRSALVNRLVSSQAYRQLEFLAVSSFFVVEETAGSSSPVPSLVRIPATREDVFATTALGPREKRKLMKFLKFVIAHGSDEDAVSSLPGESSSSKNTAEWQSQATAPFGGFLQSEFDLDGRIRDYVLALTLSLDGADTTVADGIFRLHRHITSMGAFGPGFAAVYPKWGGCSEISQVSCRAGAVGGAVYMLGAGIRNLTQVAAEAEDPEKQDKLVDLELTNDIHVKARLIIGGDEELGTTPALVLSPGSSEGLRPSASKAGTQRLSRLVAVIGASLPFLFTPPVEGAPVAGGAVVAIPAGRPVLAEGLAPEHPVFAMAHSSDTGECPLGQCVLYLATVHTDNAKAVLNSALDTLLAAFAKRNDEASPAVPPQQLPCLYKLYYEQLSCGGAPSSQPAADSASSSRQQQESVLCFTPLPADLTVPDGSLDAVRGAWMRVMGHKGVGEEAGVKSDGYMVFTDREGGDMDDDAYD